MDNNAQADNTVPKPKGELLEQLLDTMPQLIWIARPDGTLEYCNKHYHNFSGIYPNPDGTWEWLSSVHPSDRKETTITWIDALSSGNPFYIVHRRYHSDNSVHWYITHAVAHRDISGNISRWYGVATNVNVLKKINEDQEKYWSRQKELIETANSIIIRFDATGKIRYVNTYGLSFLGYCSSDVIAQNVFLTIPTVNTADNNPETIIREIIEKPHLFCFVINQVTKKDGTKAWISWTNKAILDENRHIDEVLAIGNDISALGTILDNNNCIFNQNSVSQLQDLSVSLNSLFGHIKSRFNLEIYSKISENLSLVPYNTCKFIVQLLYDLFSNYHQNYGKGNFTIEGSSRDHQIHIIVDHLACEGEINNAEHYIFKNSTGLVNIQKRLEGIGGSLQTSLKKENMGSTIQILLPHHSSKG